MKLNRATRRSNRELQTNTGMGLRKLNKDTITVVCYGKDADYLVTLDADEVRRITEFADRNNLGA